MEKKLTEKQVIVWNKLKLDNPGKYQDLTFGTLVKIDREVAKTNKDGTWDKTEAEFKAGKDEAKAKNAEVKAEAKAGRDEAKVKNAEAKAEAKASAPKKEKWYETSGIQIRNGHYLGGLPDTKPAGVTLTVNDQGIGIGSGQLKEGCRQVGGHGWDFV